MGLCLLHSLSLTVFSELAFFFFTFWNIPDDDNGDVDDDGDDGDEEELALVLLSGSDELFLVSVMTFWSNAVLVVKL